MDIVCSQQSSPPAQTETDVSPQSIECEILQEPLDLEPDNEETDENIQTQEDIEVEQILKGILKPRQRTWDRKKKVKWDLKLRYIPWDEEKDFTIEIEIVKEIPKKVVSYRELYKKMAEEKAETERIAAAIARGELIDDAEDGDDEDEDICEIKFGKLRVSAEPGKDGRIRSPAPSLDIAFDDLKSNPSSDPTNVIKELEVDILQPELAGSCIQDNNPDHKPELSLDNKTVSNIVSPNSSNVHNSTECLNKIAQTESRNEDVTQIIITGPDRSASDQSESLETASIPHIMDAKMVPEAATFVRVEPRLRLASISEEIELDTTKSDQSYIDQMDLSFKDDEIEEIETNIPVH